MALPIKLPNYLLIKSEVGRPRLPIHKLPDNNFIYGKSAAHDKEGAKEVVNGWKFHRATAESITERDFKKLNALCVKNHISDAKGVYEFRKGRNISLPKLTGRNTTKMMLPEDNFVYGISNKPSTPMILVMTNDYGNKAAALVSEHSRIPKTERKAHLVPRINKSVQLKYSLVNKKLKDIAKDPTKPEDLFKLERFKNVSPKIAIPKLDPITQRKNDSLENLNADIINQQSIYTEAQAQHYQEDIKKRRRRYIELSQFEPVITRYFNTRIIEEYHFND